MSKLQTLKRLKAARTRIRDVAAAQAGEAGRVLLDAQTKTQQIVREIDARLDHPPIQAKRAADWLGFVEEIERARVLQQDALKMQAAAQDRTRKAQKVLQERERAVRSCDEQIDQTRAELTAKRYAAEQSLADDLSSTRSR
ncbi:MAG TPA: hypothetical protein VHB97_24660 [Polyangia bacterium]|nr:hypothetical protein [Polyangia bacterium]